MRQKNSSFHIVPHYQTKKLRLPSVHNNNLSLTKTQIKANDESSILKPKLLTPMARIRNIREFDEKKIRSNNYENTKQVVFNALLINLLKKAKNFMNEKNYDEACKHLEKCKKIERNNQEVCYLYGVCLMQMQRYEDAEKAFISILIFENSPYIKPIYLLLSICYQKVKKIDSALQTLNIILSKFSDFADAYFYRGNIFLKLNLWVKALKDIEKAIYFKEKKKIIDETHFPTHIKDPLNLHKKRAFALYKLDKIEESEKEIRKILEQDGESSEEFFLLGEINYKKGNLEEAYINYKQAIKFNNDKKSVTQSIFQITKIKIAQRDYYSAYYNIHKTQHLNIDHKSLLHFKLLMEGAIFIMRKKFEEGVTKLEEIQKIINLTPELDKFIIMFRGYSNFCLGKYKEAYQDYKKLKKYNFSDPGVSYNKKICKALINSHDFQISIRFFQKAFELSEKTNFSPLLYVSTLSLIKLGETNKTDQKYLKFAEDNIIIAQELNSNNAQILLMSSVISFLKKDYETALRSIGLTIEKAEQNNFLDYFLRACISFALSDYSTALSDFSIALSLTNDSPSIIYNKALCLINLGDSKTALEEFNKFLTSLQIPENEKYIKFLGFPLNMQEIQNSLFVGDFYFSAGFFEEAFQIYENCDIDPLFKLERKFCCLFALKELSNAIEFLEHLYAQTENKAFYLDLQVLLSLKMASEEELKGAEEKLEGIEEEGYVFKKWDVYFFKGIMAFFVGKMEKAYELMERAKENLLLESEEIDRMNTIFIYEIEINQIICLIQMKNYQEAKQLASQVLENIAEEYKENLYFILSVILKELKEESCIESDLNEEEENSYIEIFSSENRLCSIYPSIKLNLNRTPNLETRLSFCLPKIRISYHPIDNELAVLKYLNVKDIESRPEAPWIKKQNNLVLFSDDIEDIDVHLSKDFSEDNPSEKISEINSKSETHLNNEDFKRMFKLDSQIEKKLQKIMNKNK